MTRGAKHKTPGKTPVKLVSQVHGGALRVGNPGNAGGGRPKDRVRAACLASFEQRIPKLEAIADESKNEAVQIKAIETLGRFGLSEDRPVAFAAAGQIGEGEGAVRFTLVLGERVGSDD